MKKQTFLSGLFLLAIIVLAGYVAYLQCRLGPIPPDDKPKVISETFDIVPEDFIIADGGGAGLYKGNLTLWQSAEQINGAAQLIVSEGFEYGILTLELQVRRDNPETAGGLQISSATGSWALDFLGRENAAPFTVVSDTLNFTNIGNLNFVYTGEAGCNVDIMSGKLKLFKTVTNDGE